MHWGVRKENGDIDLWPVAAATVSGLLASNLTLNPIAGLAVGAATYAVVAQIVSNSGDTKISDIHKNN
jgi:uncharacterized membrane protein